MCIVNTPGSSRYSDKYHLNLDSTSVYNIPVDNLIFIHRQTYALNLFRSYDCWIHNWLHWSLTVNYSFHSWYINRSVCRCNDMINSRNCSYRRATQSSAIVALYVIVVGVVVDIYIGCNLVLIGTLVVARCNCRIYCW